MAAATTAYNGIKKAVSVGREISAMTGAVSQWSKAVSDLDFLEDKAKNPPMYKMFSDNQSNALGDMVTETEAQRDARRA